MTSLQQSDRDALRAASQSLSTHALAGSLIGLSLGAWAAFRLRRIRTQMFNAFRASERPTHVKFASGREEAIPDMTELMKPTPLGDVATYLFLGSGGLFIGGEMGILSGGWSARKTIASDPESRKRIEAVWRGFKADVLKREVLELEKGGDGSGAWGRRMF